VREEFSHLLIDEFQDTDPLQIEIATLIAGDATNGEPPPWQDASVEEGRLFFVGDPKQSIYAFRRADIILYQRAQERYDHATVYLTANFRSHASLIEWVNHVFGGLMGAGDTSGQATYVDLRAGRPQQSAEVTVQLLGGPQPDDLQPIRRREARDLTRLIRRAKAEGWPVIDREGATRAARYGDIAVLIPARTVLNHIEDALEEAGVPYRVESRSLVYATQEVRDLLSTLRAIDDPTDEVALIASLRSPALACDDDALLRYKRAGGRWDYRLDPPATLSADDAVVTAMRWLHTMHRRRWWEPISAIVEAVIRERRLFELAFAHRRPRERWQRLRFVLDQSRAFAEAGGRTLRQFIDWAERQADEGTRVVETVVPEPDDDAVRIMTIHAAKGLEFPVVIMAGLNIEKGSGKTEAVLWTEDGDVEVVLGAKEAPFQTPGYDVAKTRHDQLEAYEKIRLLYVAATRARDHLIVSLYHREGKECHAKTLLERLQEARHLYRIAEPSEVLVEPPPAPATFDDSAAARHAWIEERQRRIEALARAARASAVEIAKAAGDDPNLRKDPPVEEVPPWRRGRAGTALGRAVHAVLQSIDLAGGGDTGAAARAQAAAEGIAGRADDVERLVRIALNSDAVRAAVASGRYWREVYVSAQVNGVTVEGFIDLLYETPEGLVVVDYKTDALPDQARLDEALARYRLQGAAYALALQESLGRPVTRCTFVFVQARAGTDRDVDDLDAALADVRGRLTAIHPGTA
jgi:ATP-dependent exoDNAse (exonuclease V) beta subunit